MYWLISLLIGLFLHPQIYASGVFELKLLSFDNEAGKDESGKCCSGKLTDQKECEGDCRPRFRICLKEYQAKIDTLSPCTFGDVITSELGGRPGAADEDPQSGFANPIALRFPFTWPGTFSLIVEAWHGNQSDRSAVLVSRLMRQRWLDVGDGWTQDKHNSKYSTLTFEYRVTCELHYYGKGCENLCRPRDDNFGHFSCSPTTGERVCLAGWTGDYCTKAQCLPGCDEQHGHCSQPNECKCQSGWEGPLCDQCHRYPGCMHGSCVKPWDCLCDEGWGGLFCNQDLNFCTNHRPCRNGGTCFNTGQGSYTCKCPPGFNGTDCETRINHLNRTCKYGEICNEDKNSLSKCPKGFRGNQCQIPIITSVSIDCSSFICDNGGTCLETADGLKCICQEGFTGINCNRTILNICEISPCENGGTCFELQNGTNDFQCKCPTGFTGDRCQIDIDDCTSDNPCLNGGTCLDKINEFRCQCIPGFVGRLCQNRVDYCVVKPCANGGTCHQLINDYECQCIPGYGGKDCSEEVKECLSAPCQNGGTCIRDFNTPSNYKCLCNSGFTGINCTDLLSYIEASSSARVSTESGLSTGHIILIATLSVSTPVITFIAIIAIIYFKRRRKREKAQADEEAKLQNEQNIANSNYIGKHSSALLMAAATTTDLAPHVIKNRWDGKCTNNVLEQEASGSNTPTCDLEQPKEREVIDGRPIYYRLHRNLSQQKQLNKELQSASVTGAVNSSRSSSSVLLASTKLHQGLEHDDVSKRLSVMSQSDQSSKDTPIFVVEDHYRLPINNSLFATEV